MSRCLATPSLDASPAPPTLMRAGRCRLKWPSMRSNLLALTISTLNPCGRWQPRQVPSLPRSRGWRLGRTSTAWANISARDAVLVLRLLVKVLVRDAGDL